MTPVRASSIAAVAAVLLPLAALAQLPPPRTPEPRMPPKPGLREPTPRPTLPGVSLTWFGQSAFALKAPSGATVLIDPFAPQIGLPAPAAKLPVDVVAITHEHFDHNDVGDWAADTPKVLHGLTDGGKDYAKVDETVKGVRITTIPAFHDDQGGKERGKDAIFVFDVGGLRVVHLGDFGQARLTPEQKQALGKVDVLLVPVGGFFTIGPEQAAALVKDIAPRRAAIPMHYRVPGLGIEQLGPVDPFLAAFPADRVRRLDESNVDVLPAAKETGGGYQVLVLQPAR